MKTIPNEVLLDLLPRYSALEKIAKGGFKTVYRAELAGGVEALKVVSIPDGSESKDHEKFRDECVARVEREVKILEQCVSPFLVKTGETLCSHHRFSGDDFVIYSEEFLDGEDLWKIVRSEDRKSPLESEVKELLASLLKAIKELWSMGVIHRDIKPLNVMKTPIPGRKFVLIDLGIAFSMHDTALTFNASVRDPMATFRYIAPERCDPRHRANLDYRCDIYSAALTVFEYAAGKHPIAHDSDDKVKTVTRALMEEATPLADLRTDLDPALCRIIDQMLKKNPALRPANLTRLIKQLES